MDAISLIMFSFTFLLGFVFSLLGLFELKAGVHEPEAQITGLFFNIIAAILWFVLAMFWPALATNEMYVPLGYLWYGFGFIFTVTTLTCVLLMLKFSVSKQKGSGLEIREENS